MSSKAASAYKAACMQNYPMRLSKPFPPQLETSGQSMPLLCATVLPFLKHTLHALILQGSHFLKCLKGLCIVKHVSQDELLLKQELT